MLVDEMQKREWFNLDAYQLIPGIGIPKQLYNNKQGSNPCIFYERAGPKT